jgi:hypothetical protein
MLERCTLSVLGLLVAALALGQVAPVCAENQPQVPLKLARLESGRHLEHNTKKPARKK